MRPAAIRCSSDRRAGRESAAVDAGFGASAPGSAEYRPPDPVTRMSMTKSELIEILTQRQGHLKADDVDLAVKSLLEMMGGALSEGDRIEIRGFGSFSLHYRPPRTGRNPKTGDAVALPGKHVPHFKPGKELRDRVSGVVPLPSED
jgi:integration host factor subunit beta